MIEMKVAPIENNTLRTCWPYFKVGSSEINAETQECDCWNDHFRTVHKFFNVKCRHLRAFNYWLSKHWMLVFKTEGEFAVVTNQTKLRFVK